MLRATPENNRFFILRDGLECVNQLYAIDARLIIVIAINRSNYTSVDEILVCAKSDYLFSVFQRTYCFGVWGREPYTLVRQFSKNLLEIQNIQGRRLREGGDDLLYNSPPASFCDEKIGTTMIV